MREERLSALGSMQYAHFGTGQDGALDVPVLGLSKWWDPRMVSARPLPSSIDASHHPTLKALGAKVIGYDFQDVSSLATVSQVIMNPPYLHGCTHVLHALID